MAIAHDSTAPSSYEVKAFHENLKLIVGWNPKLFTYYLQVILLIQEDGKQKESSFINFGVTQEDIVEVEVLDRIIKKYSKASDGLSPAIYKKLHDDAVWPEDAEDDDV